MSNTDYYERWLKIKNQIEATFQEDTRLQELATELTGIKPQATAVEIVARVYCKYCELYNNLCDCYDQMEQVQRRPYIKNVIDAVTCRLFELKTTLEEVEAFEFTYPENALVQMLMVPQDIQILCPFHYPFEIREAEMQYIIDQTFAKSNEKQIANEAEDAAPKQKVITSEESIADESIQLSPEELAALKLEQEYNTHLLNIQRMERSRCTVRQNTRKFNKDTDLYLILSGSKAPEAKESLRIKAASYIQKIYREFMWIKRNEIKEIELKVKLGMIIPSWIPPSAKDQLEKVKESRRNFRRQYYEKWLKENVKENSRVLKLREGDVMEDISSEIRYWLREWYDEVRQFDEFPWPDEGGSILIVSGQTFSIPEYIEWRTAEEKRLKAEAGSPKSKEQINAEKKAAREEKKRLELEAKIREEKMKKDYRKQRLNPESDPGVYFKIGNCVVPAQEAWAAYQNQWKDIDQPSASLDVIKGYIMQLVTENAYKDMHLSLRPIVDEMMRLELAMLKKALKEDYAAAGVDTLPLTKKRKKPRKPKKPKPEKISPAEMFQELVDEEIIKKYPHVTLDEYWGDQNFAAADTRAVPWTPTFPPPCLGDVKEQVRIRCILALGSNCENAVRSQVIVGPKKCGKRTLIHAIATETNSILIDLSPMNVYNKYPGPKNLKKLFMYVNKVSRLMQPSIVFVNDADKIFYKKVPKEEKMFDPTRLQKDFFKEMIKPIQFNDKIMILGTSCEPWLAKEGPMYKVFPSAIVLPRSDYGSISYILTKTLMKYHGLNREFNLHSVAQALRGYDVNSIRKGIDSLLNARRIAELQYKPLQPTEVLRAVLDVEDVGYADKEDYDMYMEWYNSYSPWGELYTYYMEMLESQLILKLKADKKKKKAK